MNMSTNARNDLYLSKIINKHGDAYDYSLVDYKDTKSNIKIICKTHGLFEQRADVHLAGGGCKKCNRNKYLREQFKYKGEDFISKSKELHGDLYDYSKVKYTTCCTKVIIICKKHGEFLQDPSNHMIGRGCRK